MNILLAEDDPNISTIAKLTLESIGQHKVTLAEDGEMALKLALEQDFDLILLDEMMPKLNGMKVCVEYKMRAAKPTPVIFLSAKSQQEDIEQFKQIALGFIAKPFDPATLCQTISAILEDANEHDT